MLALLVFQPASLHVRPAGLDVAPVGLVDLVHGGEVVHIGEEDVDLDDVLDGGAGLLEDGRQVLDALVLFQVSITGLRVSGGGLTV